MQALSRPFIGKVKDIVTGFEGIASGITSYLTGCDQVIVDPGLDKDGDLREPRAFDISRLDVIEKKAVVIKIKKDKDRGCDYNVTKIKKRR